MFVSIIVIQFVTFIGIIVALRGLLYRNAQQAVNRLQVLHEETLEKESVLKEEITSAKQLREEEAVKAKEEAEKIVEESREKAQQEAEKLLDEAREEGKRIAEKAEGQLEKFKTRVKDELETQSIKWIEKAIDLVLDPHLKKSFHHDLVEQVITELETAGEKTITEIKDIKEVEDIEVISAGELAEDHKERVNKLLRKCFSEEVKFHFKVNASLLGGIVIDLRKKILDGSIRNRISQALKKVQEV